MEHILHSTELMGNLTNLGSFLFAIICITLVPGADLLLLIRTTMKDGVRQAMKVLLGICTSTTTWNLLAVIGLSALLAKSPKSIQILKAVGGVYLFYLGANTIYSTFKKQNVSEEINSGSTVAYAGFATGFITDFVNPDTGLFTLTFFPHFIMPGYSPQYYLLLLTAIQAIAMAVTFTILILLGSKGSTFLTHPTINKVLDWLSGAFFMYFGAMLLWTLF